MEKSSIAVDICNTLADINSQLESVTCVSREPGIYTHPYASTDFFIQNPQVYENAQVLNDAVFGLNLFANKYNIVYLTARKKESEIVTYRWLKKNGFPKGNIVFSTDKVADFKALNCVFALEDAPHELNAYQQAGLLSFAKAWDYNTFYANRFDSFVSLFKQVLSMHV